MKIPNKDKSLALFHINSCSPSKSFDDLQHLFFIEFTPIESSAGGTILYIANHLSCKPRLYLNIYKSNELESTFSGILNPKKLILLLVVSINIIQWTLMVLTLII